jgi:hypothetical protein
MRQIYTNSESVYAWLGEKDEMIYSNTAMTYLRTRDVFEAATVSSKRFWTSQQSKAVLSLCERAYWTQVCIVQGLSLPKEVAILCGSKAIPWCLLERFFHDVSAIVQLGWGQHTGVYPISASAASKIVKAKSDWKEQPSLPLLTLLQLCRHKQSTDIRDRIYALCGLANDSGRLEIEYGIATKQLLVVMLQHTCTTFHIGVHVSELRIQISRIRQLLQDLLKVHIDDEQLEIMIMIRINQLRFREECLSIVSAGLAYDMSRKSKDEIDRAAELDRLRTEEEQISLNVEARFESYMERTYSSGSKTRGYWPIERLLMYFHFVRRHQSIESMLLQLRKSCFQAPIPGTRNPPRLIECELCRCENVKCKPKDNNSIEIRRMEM